MNFESQPEHSGNSFLRKKFKELPIFFPCDYKNANALGVVRSYKLNIGQRLFMTFKDQRGSKLGMILRFVTKCAILLNAGAYVWSWSPVNMVAPSKCSHPVCVNDPVLCPGSVICEPELDVRMLKVQIACMLVLLANFTIPALLCWTVPARLAGVLDLSKESQKADELVENARFNDDETTTRKRSSSAARHKQQYAALSRGKSDDSDIDADPKYSFFKQVYRYYTTGRSLRALIGNVPLFLAFLLVEDLSKDGILVYVARMTTLVQLVDFISGKKTSQVTRRTLARAYPTMLFMIWCIFLLAVVVGAIIFLLERGDFTVTEDYPDGAFLRPTVTGRGKEESPFTSMALSLYWVVVTITSVGYGELVCTSAYGRLISVMLMILSIFVLALPIAVIGQILTEEMENYMERKAQKETRVAKEIGVDKSSDLLKKYSSTIERRKSQFVFDLPSELKAEADRRTAMMVKMNSANASLQQSALREKEKPNPILKKSTSFPNSKEMTSSLEKSSTSKLFNSVSWNNDKNSDDTPDSDIDDENDQKNGTVAKHQVEFVLGSSSSPPKTSKSKAEVKWDDSLKDVPEASPSSSKTVALSTMTRPSPQNRKNPMLRPATAKKMMSDTNIYRMNSPGRSPRHSSSPARIREIDIEIRTLEVAYLKQMQQCTELHNKIVSLMKEKNAALHEAML